jgi:hypothetical protein
MESRFNHDAKLGNARVLVRCVTCAANLLQAISDGVLSFATTILFYPIPCSQCSNTTVPQAILLRQRVLGSTRLPTQANSLEHTQSAMGEWAKQEFAPHLAFGTQACKVNARCMDFAALARTIDGAAADGAPHLSEVSKAKTLVDLARGQGRWRTSFFSMCAVP